MALVSLVAVDEENITPCNHEEADTRIFLHVKHLSEAGHQKVSITSIRINRGR